MVIICKNWRNLVSADVEKPFFPQKYLLLVGIVYTGGHIDD
jgi:hypothetical protein